MVFFCKMPSCLNQRDYHRSKAWLNPCCLRQLNKLSNVVLIHTSLEVNHKVVEDTRGRLTPNLT